MREHRGVIDRCGLQGVRIEAEQRDDGRRHLGRLHSAAWCPTPAPETTIATCDQPVRLDGRWRHRRLMRRDGDRRRRLGGVIGWAVLGGAQDAAVVALFGCPDSGGL